MITYPVPTHPTTHPDAAAPLRVVIAYDDVRAGRRALSMLTRLLHETGSDVHLFPELWRFDVLQDPEWRKQAIADGARADMIILSTGGPGPVPPAVDEWMSAVLEARRGESTAVVASFGPEDDWSISIQETPEPAGCGNARPGRWREYHRNPAAAG